MQNADQIAAGVDPGRITIIGTEYQNGFVRVKYSDGREADVVCSQITPRVCE